MGTINNWGEGVVASVLAALLPIFAALPRVFGFGIILVIGRVISALVAKALTAVLRRGR